ncbi:MAG: aldo/keto reductase, partial [Clostridia bacterium]|nr:aldo/keto reductase [Clostridia bacterium]
YLVHALQDTQGWDKAKANGLLDFLKELKAKGTIRNIGFSYHGDKHHFKQVIDDFEWDFCQIQYNYIDEHSQAGREGLQYAFSKGVDVVIMEPLRGGSLVGRMPDVIKKIWDKADVKRAYAQWALLWLWNQPEVSVVLSGLNHETHIQENIDAACMAKPGVLTEDEQELLSEVKDTYLKIMKVGCTGCSYCLPCPKGVNIPMCFNSFNTYHLFNEGHTKIQYLLFNSGATGGKNALASQCVDCGKCERVCPQHLPIRTHLKAVKKEMEPWWSKPLIGTVRTGLKIAKVFSGKNKKKPAEEA